VEDCQWFVAYRTLWLRGSLTVSSVLSIGHGLVTELLLNLDNLLDVLVLDRHQLRLVRLLLHDLSPLLDQLLRSEERSQVLSPEGRVAVQLSRHGDILLTMIPENGWIKSDQISSCLIDGRHHDLRHWGKGEPYLFQGQLQVQ